MDARFKLSTFSSRCVLVVDDDSRVRESLKDLLESAGIAALCFSSAKALLLSDALSFAHCLITDVRMPGMDGWELQCAVNEAAPRTPVIFISAFQEQLAVDRARELGAIAFFFKPFDAEELLRAVESVLPPLELT